MTIPIGTITAAIAGLTVTGVTIVDTNGLRDHYEHRDLPLLAPRPNQFATFGAPVRDTYGNAATARKTQMITLAYRFFHTDAGEGRGEYDIFPDFVSKVFAINDALIAADALAGQVDMAITGMPSLGVVTDGAGGQMWGCDIDIQCMVYIN